MALIAEQTTGTAALTDPTFWVNLGALGAIFLFFVGGKLFSKSSVDDIQANAKTTQDQMRASYQQLIDDAKQREQRLIAERDRALAERDEMIDVLKEFTHTAGGLLGMVREQVQWRPTSTRKRTGGADDR